MRSDSLRFQLLARSLVILAAVLIIIGSLQYVTMQNIIYRNKATSLFSQVMSLPASTWDASTLAPSGKADGPPPIFVPGASVAFIDLQGQYFVVASGRRDNVPPRLPAEVYARVLDQFLERGPDMDYMLVDQGAGEQMVLIQPVRTENGAALGVVQISTPTEPLQDLLFGQLLAFFFIAMTALLIGMLVFSPVLKRTLVPLSNMIDTAAQIDAGNLDKRLPTDQGQMEIDQLAESFNGMLERLEDSFAAEKSLQEKMRRFIADAAHELRTPLTSIHGFLEVLLRGAMNQPEQLEKALKSMHSESKRLNKLVHDLLILSKLDRIPVHKMEPGQLETVMANMEPQLRILAGGRELILNSEADLRCKFDVDQMKQVVLNLFHNAVQHTDPVQGRIEITASRRDGGVELTVKDNGPGISQEHLPFVFDRFYRSDSARARKDGGAGLGLAITKSIVEAHGGTIEVSSDDGKGATFSVWLPNKA
ncbi:MAG: HAMP domain-containing protein [Syntrophomonadaceae bacterium]|nr:HAMP domain-containing protein [Syntrophomonadaceae bacterium]